MKRAIIIFIACISLSGLLHAQRYLTGQQGIQLTYGEVNGIIPLRTFYAGAAVATYTQNGSHWVFGGEYLQKQINYRYIQLPVAQFTGEGGYYYGLLSDPSRTFLLSIGASALAGYETSNWGNKMLYDGATLLNQDAFLYGGAITIELEAYITDQIVFLINARERILWGSSIGKYTTQFGAGLKIIIN
ncbi:MAG: conjugal transfer protein [Paludibacter sp.]|nr:conjugal transfer protein [Paludibacter sp.]